MSSGRTSRFQRRTRSCSGYKGLALSSGPAGDWLYAGNFHAATIDVFDSKFHQVHWAGAFHDSKIPTGYAPFNIQNLGDKLYVTYAVQKPDKMDDARGTGRGFVDICDLTSSTSVTSRASY